MHTEKGQKVRGIDERKWETLRYLSESLGLYVDDRAFKKVGSASESDRFLEVIRNSSIRVFELKYSRKDAERITDLMLCPGTPLNVRPSGLLPLDDFARIVYNRYEEIAGTGNAGTYEGFRVLFDQVLQRIRLTIKSILFSTGIKKEIISLTNPDIKEKIEELNLLPCRRLGELNFSAWQASTSPGSLSEYMESLIKRYEGRVISKEHCDSILSTVYRISRYPGHYRIMDLQNKLLEIKPILLAVSQLQFYNGKEQEKSDLLASLGILLINLSPSPRLIKFLAKFEPASKNQVLMYEYNAIMAINYMLMGKLNMSSSYNAKAFQYAYDEGKRVYSCILSSCIHINRNEYDEAINILEGYTPMVRDRKNLAMMKFYTGIIYFELGDIDRALHSFKESSVGLEDYIDLMNVYNNIGTCAMLKCDVREAIKAFEEAERLGSYTTGSTARKLAAVTCGNLGIIYLNMLERDLAMDYFKKALRLSKESDNKKGIANQLGNIGLTYKSMMDHRSATEHFKAMLNYSYNIDYLEGVLFSFSQISQSMTLQGKYEEVDAFMKETIKRHPGLARLLNY